LFRGIGFRRFGFRGFGFRGLALSLFEAGILLIYDKSFAFSDNDLAIFGASFNAASDFHNGKFQFLGSSVGK